MFTKDSLSRTIEWDGDCINGFAEGTGIARHFNNGVLLGTLEGTFVKGKVSGMGTINANDGTKYVGEFKDAKKHGQGTLTTGDGFKYVGAFKDDKPSGQGTVTFANGDKYVGEFKDGKYNGRGKLTGSDGRSQEGIWAEDNFVRADTVNLPPIQKQADGAVKNEQSQPVNLIANQDTGVSKEDENKTNASTSISESSEKLPLGTNGSAEKSEIANRSESEKPLAETVSNETISKWWFVFAATFIFFVVKYLYPKFLQAPKEIDHLTQIDLSVVKPTPQPRPCYTESIATANV